MEKFNGKSSYAITYICNSITELMTKIIDDTECAYSCITDYESSVSICKDGKLAPSNVKSCEFNKKSEALKTVGIEYCIPEDIVNSNPEDIKLDDVRTIDCRLLKLCDFYLYSSALYERKELREVMKDIKQDEIVKRYNKLIAMAKAIKESGLDIQLREMSDDEVYSIDIERLSQQDEISITR